MNADDKQKPTTPRVLGAWEPVPAAGPDPRPEADRAEAAALLSQANQMHADAKQQAERMRKDAEAEIRSLRARELGEAGARANRIVAEAQQIRDQAAAAVAQQKETAKKLDTWSARAVIAGAVGLTASGEYSLALMAGFLPGVAWLLPFVIDVYVIQAFRRHRDVAQAIGLTIAANVIYHLASVGLFGVNESGKPEWWLIAIVASIASLILWRMHQMIAPKRERKRWRRERKRRPESALTAAPATPVESARETTMPLSPAAGETSHQPPIESAPETSRESTGKPRETTLTAPAAKRESKPKPQRKRRESKSRESAPQVSPIGDIDREIAALVALMEKRGGADEVKLSDAERITGKAPATAARRLSVARAQYRHKHPETA